MLAASNRKGEKTILISDNHLHLGSKYWKSMVKSYEVRDKGGEMGRIQSKQENQST